MTFWNTPHQPALTHGLMVVAQNGQRRYSVPFGQVNFQALSSLTAWPLLTKTREGTTAACCLAVWCAHIPIRAFSGAHPDKLKLCCQKGTAHAPQTGSQINIPKVSPGLHRKSPTCRTLGSTRLPSLPKHSSLVGWWHFFVWAEEQCKHWSWKPAPTAAFRSECYCHCPSILHPLNSWANMLVFCLLFCIMYHWWLSPNKSLLELLKVTLCPGLQLTLFSYCPFGKHYVASCFCFPAPVEFQRCAPDKALSLLKSYALDMAGMELIFFLAAQTVLCFRFVTSSVLIAHQCSSSCWTVLTEH